MSVVRLVQVDGSILSSYDRSGKTGGQRSNLTPLKKLASAGVAHPEMAPALLALSEAVTAAGGDFRVTECHRNIGIQRRARQKYDNWVAAGKPKPGAAAWNASNMKNAFVALPGRSGHNAGRSIDVHIQVLNFPGVPRDKQLDRLWDLAIPLGWSPVIKTADEGAKESWHFDFIGELSGVKARLGYEQWALCGAILVGHGDLVGYEAEVQALLCRAGFDIGKIDGAAGKLTRSGLATALGVSVTDAKSIIDSRDPNVMPRLLSLPAR